MHRMVNLLVDSCVWLDIPKDPAQAATLSLVEELVKLKEVSLIVPQTVLAEIARNKPRVIKDCGQSLSSVVKRAKDVIARMKGNQRRQRAMDHLHDLDLKLPFLEEAAEDAFSRIDTLLGQFPHRPATDAILAKAAQRSVNRAAPCHRGQNSINDAIIIETYLAAMEGVKGARFIFVTHNKQDFSLPNGDQRLPHPDLAPLFSKIKSRYFISLVDALRRIRPDVRAELADEFTYTDQFRTPQEISAAMGELIDKIWYNRHKIYEEKILSGKVKLVKTYNNERHDKECVESIWNGALKSAKRVEDTYGPDSLIWNDFEWGMLNGKLSALRWMFGEEWDSLYT
jgi:hypothetical protein